MAAAASRILMAMIWSNPRLFQVLRVSMLTLLVLGIAIRPVLQFVGEAHASDHRVAVEFHGHDHGHGHGHDSEPANDPAPDHASGVHGLMHQSSGGGTFSVNTLVMSLPEVAFELLATPVPVPSRVPLQLIEGPFRPPIA